MQVVDEWHVPPQARRAPLRFVASVLNSHRHVEHWAWKPGVPAYVLLRPNLVKRPRTAVSTTGSAGSAERQRPAIPEAHAVVPHSIQLVSLTSASHSPSQSRQKVKPPSLCSCVTVCCSLLGILDKSSC